MLKKNPVSLQYRNSQRISNKSIPVYIAFRTIIATFKKIPESIDSHKTMQIVKEIAQMGNSHQNSSLFYYH